MKYFFQNITFLNIILLTVIIFMANDSLLPFLHTQIRYVLPSQKLPAETAKGKQTELSPPSPADYAIIADENLFHPERIIPPEKKAEQELPKPDFVLYGTMVSDDINLAFLEDLKAPRNTPGRGKRQVALKKGDTFSGFTLKEIEQGKIVMVRGEEIITVSVVDPQKPKAREVSATVSQKAPGQPPQKTQKASRAPAQPPAQPRKQTPASGPASNPSQPEKSWSSLPPGDERMRQLFQR